jgi:hypothetical protein
LRGFIRPLFGALKVFFGKLPLVRVFTVFLLAGLSLIDMVPIGQYLFRHTLDESYAILRTQPVHILRDLVQQRYLYRLLNGYLRLRQATGSRIIFVSLRSFGTSMGYWPEKQAVQKLSLPPFMPMAFIRPRMLR